jgi:glycine/D-amino acid oxidase-like deaminating enzyme
MHKSQNAAGYASDLYIGKEAKSFLTGLWPDFKTDGIDVVLHERPSGYAGTRQFVRGMTEKLQAEGVRLVSGVAVTGYDLANGTVKAVLTDAGPVRCEAVVLAPGAWISQHWRWLGQPERLTCRYPDGGAAETDMWTYWRLLEGEVYLDRPYRTAADRDPPVLHVELMNTAVVGPEGRPFDDHLYVYWKNAAERMDGQGVQGGTIPIRIGPDATLEPYGHANDEYQADAWFADYFCAAMGQLMGRFEGSRRNFRERRNGGIGAFTPDNVPIFDWLLPNLYMIADSNHGFKMTGVGKLVAKLMAGGNRVPELEPFALSRFAKGRTFGSHNSHCPWV